MQRSAVLQFNQSDSLQNHIPGAQGPRRLPSHFPRILVNNGLGIPRRFWDEWRGDRRLSGLPFRIVAYYDSSSQQFRN